MGLVPNNINVDVFGILFDASIVLILYVISFYYIENKQNEKDANARDIFPSGKHPTNGAYRSAVLISIARKGAFQARSVSDALGRSRKMP